MDNLQDDQHASIDGPVTIGLSELEPRGIEKQLCINSTGGIMPSPDDVCIQCDGLPGKECYKSEGTYTIESSNTAERDRISLLGNDIFME